MLPQTKSQRRKNTLTLFFISFVIGELFFFGLSQAALDPFDFGYFTKNFLSGLSAPWAWQWCPFSEHFLIAGLVLFLFAGLYYAATPHNFRHGQEHGAARWATVRETNRAFKQRTKPNIILSKKVRVSLDMYHHQRNLNCVVFGGSGASKTRSYVMPNILSGLCNYMITDPKGEILRTCGKVLQGLGYTVKVFNLLEPERSDCFNPFPYIKDEKDVLSLVTNYLKNTTPPESRTNDPFWEKAEYLVIGAICMFLWEAVPVRDQNFGNVIKLFGGLKADESGTEYSILDRIFIDYRIVNPESVACKLFQEFRDHAKGKTLQSILITCGTRLVPFWIPQIQTLVEKDDMHIETLPTTKTAIFCVIPDDDPTYNFLVSMFYTSYYKELYHQSYKYYDSGRLPIHQMSILDEFRSVALPDAFLTLLSTMRSRNISASMLLQNMEQIKFLFEKEPKSLVGHCDLFLYLGGNEEETHEYISKLLGTETIDKKTENIGRGAKGSSSINRDKMGTKLMEPDQVRILDRRAEIIFLGSARPVCDFKYKLKKHPRYKESGLYRKRNAYRHPLRETVKSRANVVPSSEKVPEEASTKQIDLLGLDIPNCQFNFI